MIRAKTYIGLEPELLQGKSAVLVEVCGLPGDLADLLVGEGSGPRVHVVVDDHLQDGAPEQRLGGQLKKEITQTILTSQSRIIVSLNHHFCGRMSCRHHRYRSAQQL